MRQKALLLQDMRLFPEGVPLKNGLGVLEAFFHFFLGSCRVVIIVKFTLLTF